MTIEMPFARSLAAALCLTLVAGAAPAATLSFSFKAELERSAKARYAAGVNARGRTLYHTYTGSYSGYALGTVFDGLLTIEGNLDSILSMQLDGGANAWDTSGLKVTCTIGTVDCGGAAFEFLKLKENGNGNYSVFSDPFGEFAHTVRVRGEGGVVTVNEMYEYPIESGDRDYRARLRLTDMTQSIAFSQSVADADADAGPISPVPVGPAAPLLASALFGFAALRRFRKPHAA